MKNSNFPAMLDQENNIFPKSNNVSKSILSESFKLDQEKTRQENRSKILQTRINSHRILSSQDKPTPLSPSPPKKRQLISYVFNPTLINSSIEEIISLFNELPYGRSLIKFPLSNINQLHSNILDLLKKIRKELSIENISKEEFLLILTDKTVSFIDLLINPFKDTNYPYIQLESLWIINNIVFFVGKYDIVSFFDLEKIMNGITQFLISYYKNIANDGVRNTLIDKIFRIYGNILSINSNSLKILIDNQIIPFIIDRLNSPISEFRSCSLWLLNKILLSYNKIKLTIDKLYINLNINQKIPQVFISKFAIVNYKFIISRNETQKNFEEVCELFWLFNELIKYDPNFLNPIFFTENFNQNLSLPMKDSIITSTNTGLKNFSVILNHSLSNKMIQACFRLISNLIALCPDESINKKFVEKIFDKKDFIIFINDVLNSPKNKYDRDLVMDVLLCVYNLICNEISTMKCLSLFRRGVVNMIWNRDYQNDNEIMKVLILAFYRLMINCQFNYEPNDEKVVKSILLVANRFLGDEIMIMIFIDILYFYLKKSKTKISDEDVRYLEYLSNESNVELNKYNEVLNNLFGLVTISRNNFRENY